MNFGVPKARSVTIFGLAVFALQFAFVPTCLAEAYRWQDSSGSVFYGSTPPAGAIGVTKLQGKSYSKYSSEKMIKGHARNDQGTARARIKEEDIPVIADAEPEDSVEQIDTGAPPKLVQGRLSITHGPGQEVTSCKISIRNAGQETAKKVSVNFEFEDGTIVPGSGPDAIAGRGEAVYFIAPQHLPIQVKMAVDTGVSYKQGPKPKIIIQYSPQT